MPTCNVFEHASMLMYLNMPACNVFEHASMLMYLNMPIDMKSPPAVHDHQGTLCWYL